MQHDRNLIKPLWSKEEITLLEELFDKKTLKELSEILGRTEKAIDTRIYLEALRCPPEERENKSNIRKSNLREQTRKRDANPESASHRKELTKISSNNTKQYRLENFLCVRCGSPALQHNKRKCLYCWVSDMGSHCGHYDKEFGKKIFELLQKQNFKCALTGETMTPGLDASLDHIVPRSRGGSLDDLNNLQWVLKKVNMAKHVASEEEFIEMCCKVAKYRGNL